MTAQLKNQDPFEPVDNTQMVAQMAQFSSLAGISEMNTTLKAIADKLGGTTTADAMSLCRPHRADRRQRPPMAAHRRRHRRRDRARRRRRPTSTSRSRTPTARCCKHRRRSARRPRARSTSTGTARPTPARPPAPARSRSRVTAQNDGGRRRRHQPRLGARHRRSRCRADGSPVLTLPGLGQVPVTAVRKIG